MDWQKKTIAEHKAAWKADLEEWEEERKEAKEMGEAVLAKPKAIKRAETPDDNYFRRELGMEESDDDEEVTLIHKSADGDTEVRL